MIVFPNCKINIGLRILRRRADGYHDIETVMFPVRGLCDAVELLKKDAPGVEFSSSGLHVASAVEKNLCVRAYNIIRERYGIGGVRMHLHKVVPMGAGLGGGSADATFVLRGLNDLFGLGITDGGLESLAAELGSDTPFFVRNRPVLATGRGEVMKPVDIDLKGYKLAVIKPDIFISTAEAYAGVKPAEPEVSLAALVKRPVSEWRVGIINDFECSVFAREPRLAELKEMLYEQGAVYASMSGSGSALYGIFPPETEIGGLSPDLFVYQEVI